MNLFFLTDHYFSLRDYDRFGIGFFLDNGVNVKILNLDHFNKNKNNVTYDIKNSEGKILNVLIYFKSNEELRSYKNNFINSFIIDLRVNNFNSYFPITWFQKLGAKIIKLETNIIPSNYASYSDKVFNFLFKSNLKKKIKVINNQFKKKDKSILYDFLIKTGEHKNIYTAKQIIRSHSFDYDYFLKLKKFKKKQNDPDLRIIFIEKGMCSHPDFELHKDPPFCTPQKYYPSLNKFFTQIEKFFNNEVTICLNPKEKNENLMSKNYDNRKTIKNFTFQAIKNCDLVISHDSTALSFAILFKKPLLIITTDEIEKNNYLSMKYLTKNLCVKSINVDKLNENLDWEYESKKIIKNFEKYKYNFIKTKKSPEEFSWKIFLDFIKEHTKVST